MAQRSEHVTDHLMSFEGDHAGLAARLRDTIHDAVDGLAEDVKWGQPCFLLNGEKVFYLADSADHVKLGFYKGAHVEDPENLLEGTGKNMRHVKVRDVEDTDALIALIQRAVS